MASKRSIARRKRIEAIRDKALKLIEVRGTPQQIRNAPGEVLGAKLGPFDMWLTQWPGLLKLPAETLEELRERGVTFDADHRLLDIWGPHGGKPLGKVMSIRWVGVVREEYEVVSFRRGEWEEEFLGLERS